ncbi:MAG: MFS transporter [Sphingomonadaceae bacterium]|uniref:MFS transporter n=1 Tax=Thermaurantiacus sp. TaxID=2820283 RepID=UPI00298EE73D|nr:MFS transporter [Thermaurantiacus sp.]MCS6987271.1 MFS transporter [Sphingomonadaceae bacterium]MDW8414491.1 MFS transporter [Thermaurantiacus sp.]
MARHSAASTAWRATATVSAYYALFGAFIPWLSRWLDEVAGFPGETIGLAVTIGTLLRIVAGPLLSAWADGRADRRTAIVALSAATVLVLVLMGPRAGTAKDFLLVVALQVCVWGLLAFLEAALIRLTGRGGGPPYGVARGLASAAFIAGNFGVGVLVDRLGPGAILGWMIAAAVAMLAGSLAMNPEPHARGPAQPFLARLSEGVGLLKDPFFLPLALAAGLVQGAHQYYYLFSNLIWREAPGLSATTIGALQALGVAAEVLFLMLLAERTARWPPAVLFLMGGLGSIVRWGGLALAPGLPLLVPLQLLHAVTFAFTFLGTMRGLQERFGDARGATAQMIYQSLANAPATAGASYLAGRLYGAGLGADGYWVMAALAAIAVPLSLALLRRPRDLPGRP